MKIIPAKPTLFPDNHCCIMLKKSQVDFSGVERVAEQKGFTEQKNLHITIIGGTAEDAISAKLAGLKSKKEKDNFLAELKELLNSFDWTFTPKDIFYIKKRGTFGKTSSVIEKRESLVRLVEMPDIDKFYKKFNELLQTNLPAHLQHITLFTKGDRPNAPWRGIGISSAEDFEKLKPERIN